MPHKVCFNPNCDCDCETCKEAMQRRILDKEPPEETMRKEMEYYFPTEESS